MKKQLPFLNRENIKKLPKTDLHVHLDGSVTPQTVHELAHKQNIDLVKVSQTMGIGDLKTGDVSELEKKIFKPTYDSLMEYLVPFEFINVVLRTYEGLKEASYRLAKDNFNEGVRYFECRFAPQKHWVSSFDWFDIVGAVNAGLKQAADEFNKSPKIVAGQEPAYKYGIILCAMRMINENMGDYYKYLYNLHVGEDLQNLAAMASFEVAKLADACREQGIPVVGFDLAGREDGFPAEVHRAAFLYCYERGIWSTCHAGEAYGPESIKSAVKDCFVRRIGHGTQLFNANHIYNKRTEKGQELTATAREAYVRSLVEWIADNRIALEVCLKSNSQTLPEYRDLANHPFPLFMQSEIRIALCTDNRAISRVSITDEYENMMKLYEISEEELKRIAIGGFKSAFYPGTYHEKRQYIYQIINFYDAEIERAKQSA